MNKSILSLIVFVIVFCISSIATAQDKILTCANKSGSIKIEICGVRGCLVTVKIGNKNTKYNLSRKKNSDGSLSYSQKAGSRPACKIEISKLRFGQRKLVSASCASRLVNSSCKFTAIGSSSSIDSQSSSSSSELSTSSSSNSSDDDSSSSSSKRSSSSSSDD